MSGLIRAGVIGHPISHSKSPLIHGHWIAQHKLKGSYEAIDIAPEELSQRVRALADVGFAGFNVTLPHKEAMFALCDEIDDTAKAIGAVNTVKIENGKLHGTNTDAFGFIANIQQNMPGFDFSAGPAVVLGAGGAARAVIYGLLRAGVPNIVLANRTRDKADALQDMQPHAITVVEWDERSDVLAGANMIVNTTSLGMSGKDALEIDLSAAPDEALVTDIVYAPLMTDLLRQARVRGNPFVTGIGMLLHQARPAFELWFGVMPEVTADLEAKVLG